MPRQENRASERGFSFPVLSETRGAPRDCHLLLTRLRGARGDEQERQGCCGTPPRLAH